ncbi:MAG: septum formation initiator [Desulfuromonas sp.]|nr:MAG: septum formation initiator [Desulfuromonas sp.]
MATKEPVQVVRHFPFWLLFVVAVILVMALLGDRGVLSTLKANRHRAELQQELHALEEERQALREEIGRLRGDREYLEQLARKRLGLVREGELVYQFDDRPPAAQD